MRGRLRSLGIEGVSARTFHAAALAQLNYFWPTVAGGESAPPVLPNKVRVLAKSDPIPYPPIAMHPELPAAVQKQLKDRRLVMASEIMNLKDLECYLKLPNYPVTKIKLDWKGYPNLNDPFIMREDMKLLKTEPEKNG